MSSNSRTTIIITLIAVVSVVVAFFYYPWPTVQGAKSIEGENLIPDYARATVRKIELTRVNEKNQIEKMILRQRGNTWVIPGKNEYVADNNTLIAVITDCLNERVVYKVQSEDQKDHQAFGVVDPDDSRGKTVGVGSKLVLSDRNGRELASLIVGNPEGEKEQSGQDEKVKYFVRRPGQPGIFLVDFQKEILTTRFSDWINPNLFRLSATQMPTSFAIDKFIVQPDTLIDQEDGNEVREQIYTTRIIPLRADMSQWGIISLQVPAKDGKLRELTKTSKPRLSNGFQAVLQNVGGLPIVDAIAKPKDSANKFANIADQPLTKEDLKAYAPAGFFVGQDGQIDGVNGRLVVGTNANVLLHLVIGGVSAGQTDTALNRYVLLYATVDRERLPKKPKPLTGADKDNNEKQAAYQKALRDFEGAQRIANNVSRDRNKDFSKWVYQIDERASQFLIPELKMLFLGSSLPDLSTDKGKQGENKSDSDSQGAGKSNKTPDANDGKKSDANDDQKQKDGKDGSEDKKTGDKKAGDKKTGDKKTGDKKASDKKAGDKKAGDKTAGDKKK